MNKFILGLALVAFTTVAQARGGVGATVTIPYFNSNTGVGFFSKDTVAGADPAGVSFTYQVTTTYSAECTWSTHDRTRYPIVRTDGANVNSALSYVQGERHVFNGYSLTGFGSLFSSGDTLPVLGTQCKKGKTIGTWTSLDLIGTDGGLYANYGTSQTLVY